MEASNSEATAAKGEAPLRKASAKPTKAASGRSCKVSARSRLEMDTSSAPGADAAMTLSIRTFGAPWSAGGQLPVPDTKERPKSAQLERRKPQKAPSAHALTPRRAPRQTEPQLGGAKAAAGASPEEPSADLGASSAPLPAAPSGEAVPEGPAEQLAVEQKAMASLAPMGSTLVDAGNVWLRAASAELSTAEMLSGSASAAKERSGLVCEHKLRRQGARRVFIADVMLVPVDILSILCCCALPSVLVVYAFSLPFWGAQVFNAIAASDFVAMKGAFSGLFVLWLLGLVILDAHRAPMRVRVALLVVTYCMGVALALLQSLSFPWAVVVLALWIGPALLYQIRTMRQTVSRNVFYISVAGCAALVAVGVAMHWGLWMWTSDFAREVGGPWTREMDRRVAEDTAEIYRHVYAPRPLSYELDCQKNATSEAEAVEDVSPTAAAVSKACARVASVHRVLLTSPVVVVAFNLAIVATCLLQAPLNLERTQGVSKMVHHSAAVIVAMWGGVVFLLTPALGFAKDFVVAVVLFCLMAFAGLSFFIWSEVRWDVLRMTAESSRTLRYCATAYRSDLARAATILAWGPMVPLYLLKDVVKQLVRRARGTEDADGLLTYRGSLIVAELRSWEWVSILTRACMLVVLLVVLLLGSKITMVFFSWLNQVLAPFHLAVVVAMVCAVGLLMYMMPPVPGTAVTVFTAIVVGKKGLEPMGFWGAATLASVIAFLMKLTGSCGQYMVGYRLGQDVRVQRLIGIDKVPARAIERILKTPGCFPGKLAILVGGPDWPTSVTCGLVKMRLLEMVLGTLPVLPLSTFPQTLVVALFVVDTSTNPGFWRTVTLACTIVASVAKAATWLVAAFYITSTIERHHEELSMPRPEHEAVAKLAAELASFEASHRIATDWHGPHMTLRRKAMIVSAASAMISALLLMAADFISSAPVCFRSFEMSDDIGAPFEEGGLNGNPLNILVVPFGGVALGLVLLGGGLLQLHSREMKRVARELVAPETE